MNFIKDAQSKIKGMAEELLSDNSDDDEQKLPCESSEALPQGHSYVGEAACRALSARHPKYKGVCWNMTHGTCVGEVTQTPAKEYYKDSELHNGIEMTHSDFFPEKIAEIIGKAEEWVDFTSLGPPDGKFLDCIAKALQKLNGSGKSIVVRFLTGNIIGMPTANDELCRALTQHEKYPLDEEGSKLKLYVGSWRKLVSWNHSKIIAVDGKYLLQGGHNVWDPHYLQKNPVRDLTMEAEGQVAQDGHVFCNRMWKFIEEKDRLAKTYKTPMAFKSRVGIYRWPPQLEKSEQYPPTYMRPGIVPLPEALKTGAIPMISCGRYGVLHHAEDTANPSDSAITAMLNSAKKSIKMSLQDLGPIAIPVNGKPCAVPGTGWPKEYLEAIGRAIYERHVVVEIVLSYPNSIPSNLGMTEANYGNGWTCDDVAAEIVKAMKSIEEQKIADFDADKLAVLVGVNLRVAYMRSSHGEADWCERKRIGNHSKFFIVDDMAYYLGSQNLYVANLAEWGIIVDSQTQTEKVLGEYWNRVWAAAYQDVPESDRDMHKDKVLAGVETNRNAVELANLSPEEVQLALNMEKAAGAGGSSNKLTVWLKQASNLKNADAMGGGVSDPYAVLRIVDICGKTVKPTRTSRVVHNELNPTWNEQFDFEGLEQPGAYTLIITVLDQDTLLGLGGKTADWLVADETLATAHVDLSTLKRSDDFQDMVLTMAHFNPVCGCVFFSWKYGLEHSTLSIGLHNWGQWGKD